FEKAYKEFKYKPVTGKEITIEEGEAGELKPLEDKSFIGKYGSKLKVIPNPLRDIAEKIGDVDRYKSNINLFLSGLYKHKSKLIGDEVPPHTGEEKTDLRAYESAVQRENDLGEQTLEKLNIKPNDFEFSGIYVTPTSLNQKLNDKVLDDNFIGQDKEDIRNSVRSYMARQKQGEFIKKSSEKAKKAEELFPVEARIARIYKKYDDIESEKRTPVVGQLTKGWELGGFKQDASKTLAYLALIDPEKAKELVPAMNDVDNMIQENDQDLNKILKFGKDLAQTLQPMVTTGGKSIALSYVGLSPFAIINNYEEWGLSATGDMFQKMINEKVSPNTAINMSFAYSIPYTAIENLQFSGFSNITKKIGEKAFKGKLVSILKDYSKKNIGKKIFSTAGLLTNAASETLEESAQGFVEGYAVEVAKQIDGVSGKDFKAALKSGLKNALDSGIDSAPQMLAISILSAFTGGVGGKLLRKFSPNVKNSVETIANDKELTDDQKLEEIVKLIKNPVIKEEIKNVVIEDVVNKVIPDIPKEAIKKTQVDEQVKNQDNEDLLPTGEVGVTSSDMLEEKVSDETTPKITKKESPDEVIDEKQEGKETKEKVNKKLEEEEIEEIPEIEEEESEKKVSEKLEIQVEKSKEKITGKKSEFLLRRRYSKLPAQIKTLIDKKYGETITIEQKVLLGEKINETDNFDKEKIDESLSDVQKSLGIIPNIKDKQDVVETPSKKIEILQKNERETQKELGVKDAGTIGEKTKSTSGKNVQTRETQEEQQEREKTGRGEQVRVRKPDDEVIQEQVKKDKETTSKPILTKELLDYDPKFDKEVSKKQKDIIYDFEKGSSKENFLEVDNIINSNLIKDIEITEDSRYELNGKTTILRDNAVIIYNPETNKTRIIINKNLSEDKKAKALVHEVIGHVGISNVLNQNKEIHRQLKDLLWSEEAKGNLEDL
ncbi:MAG TPA: hypothetical protein VMZ91_01605, partial [Candidatus Paceibacterota bacterium]|nr:hypothetical protein [Candidatus Paceibacterota bacterium]